jgi:CBS domain containing-hemolysin-like protein
MTVLIFSCALAIGVSFLCSLAEATLLSVNPARMEMLRAEGRRHAGAWLNLRKNIGRPIAAILILNTIANTGGATIAGGAFDELYGERWLWLFSTAFTFSVLFGAELLPKVLGVVHGERLAIIMTPALALLIRILHPFILVTEKFSNFVGGGRKAPETVSVSDLNALALAATASGVLAKEQAAIIINAAGLRDRKIRDVMVPREWIVLIRDDAETVEIMKQARITMHTRYPVTSTGDPDGIHGYLNVKEVAFAERRAGLRIGDFLRSVLFVSPDADLNTMLHLFIARRHHLAIVKGGDGRVLGMVTLEDLLESLAGEIEDEFDERDEEMVPIGERVWRAGGLLRMETLASRAAFALPDEIGDPSQTVDRWLRSHIEGRPVPGLAKRVGRWRFTVQQVRRGLIHQVILEID